MARNTIGQVAKRAGVGVETVRFYERRGLIERPQTPGQGFREYPDQVVDRITFIRHAKDLGFTLGEIRELLSLRLHPRTNCDAIKARARRKVIDVEAKMSALAKIKHQLELLIAACEGRETTDDCPILEALE